MAFLCVDIGATNTLIGAGSGDFEAVEKVDSGAFLDDIERCLRSKVGFDMEDVENIAIAAAGQIDREEGVFYPVNLPMEKVDIRAPLQKFGEVEIVNDCTSAVVGEYFYGGHDCENLVYVTISSGIGAGVVVDGNVIEGWNGNFGEVGHMKLVEDGLECGCGGRGHWEAYCSGNNLPGLAEKVTGRSFEDAREVFEEAGRGKEDAREVMEKMREINSRAFSNLIDLYNPGKIVVGGAVALNHPEEVVEPLEEDVREEVVNRVPDIECCSLGEKSVLHGLRAVCNGKISGGL